MTFSSSSKRRSAHAMRTTLRPLAEDRHRRLGGQHASSRVPQERPP